MEIPRTDKATEVQTTSYHGALYDGVSYMCDTVIPNFISSAVNYFSPKSKIQQSSAIKMNARVNATAESVLDASSDDSSRT